MAEVGLLIVAGSVIVAFGWYAQFGQRRDAVVRERYGPHASEGAD